MKYRKIIEFGKSSYVVSIPKDWLQLQGLAKGDMVFLSEDADKISLFPCEKEDQVKKTATIDITGKNMPYLHWQLISKYIQNYDEITIVGKELEKRSTEIRELIHDLISLEVIEENGTAIVAGNFLKMDEVNTVDIIMKMDKIARDMLEDSKNSFRNNHYENIASRDGSVNRLAFLIYRAVRYLQNNSIIMKQKGLSHGQLLTRWNVSKNIEYIADNGKRIAKRAKFIKLTETERLNFEKLYADIIQFYVDSIDMFYKQDVEKAFTLGPRANMLIKKARDYRRANTGENTAIVVEKLTGIIAYSRAIMMHLCDCEAEKGWV